MFTNLVTTVVLSAATLFPQAAPAAPRPATQVPPDAIGELTVAKIIDYVHAVEMGHVVEYVRAVEHANVITYVAAVEQAQEAARQAVRPAPVTPPRASNGSVGDCTGFAIPAYIIQRESGGDPNAVNPSSGAIGCSQTLPGHYNDGATCAGLNMHTVDGQRECTWRLSDGGTNLAPWALTR